MKNVETRNVFYTADSQYIIFFDWDNSGDADHVGIVEYCENGVVHTVEGNTSDSCARRTYSVGSSSIRGYGVPDYK